MKGSVAGSKENTENDASIGDNLDTAKKSKEKKEKAAPKKDAASAGKKVGGRFSLVDQTPTFHHMQKDAQEKSKSVISRKDQQKSSRLNSEFLKTTDFSMSYSKGD